MKSHATGLERRRGWCLALLLLLATIMPACSERSSRGAGGRATENEAPAEPPGSSAGSGIVRLGDGVAAQIGIAIGTAMPAEIAEIIELPGEVRLDGERVSELKPRFSGIVREMRKHLGDKVQPDEIVAILESNESLGDYELRAGPGGTIIAVGAVPGQSVREETVLYKVADLSSLWVDAAVYPPQMGRIHKGQAARITSDAAPDLVADGTISYLGPSEFEDSRTSLARIVLRNASGRWQPGLFVTVRAPLHRARVPVAVPDQAIVRTASGTAVGSPTP